MKLTTSNEEIESMSNLLSEMHSSLESWVLRLTQSQTTTKTEVQFCKSLQKDHPSTHGEPPRMKYEEPNLDMVISPSPLVAWRAAGCQLLTEKQLFLLTPLSKIKARNPYRKNTNNTLQSIIRNSDSVSETVKELGALNPCFIEEKISMSKTTLKHHSQTDLKKKSNRRKDANEQEALEWFLSPPKTCTVMDPNDTSNPSVMAGKSSRCRNPKIATIIDDRNDPESFRGIENQDDRHLHELRLCSLARKKDSDGGLEWFLSPPKTCAVMEPLRDGKILSTPVVVDGSVIRSRRAGENTLKKELWTRFQAVSMGRILYTESGLQKVGKKGFMDMLEEAT
ncbi:uncharacterized protein LOC110018927 [Phalaenopsis equestris]|uniref:uncharacterized protein LOC110018927 n=1 Tax=Phalaenopsis equestris TaxID=78828 RepID=UPI0009E23793|nr:uncharacterized protein LOC110018927 [Phalaenopsis equestris]